MHHLPSIYSVRRFRLASWLLIMKWLLISSSLGMLVWGLLAGKSGLIWAAVVAGVASFPVALCQWIAASRARCPLCVGYPLAHRLCSKHGKASKLFGSYRFAVAASVIFLGRFLCPYCGEASLVKPRRDRPGFGKG